MNLRRAARVCTVVKGAVAILVLCGLELACTAPAGSAPTTAPATGSVAPPPMTSATPLPRATEAPPLRAGIPTTSPGPTVALLLEVSKEVPVTGDDIVVTVSALVGNQQPSIASATVAFGDGTSASVRGSCANGGSSLLVHHAYRQPGTWVLRVTAATLCTVGLALDLSTVGVTVLAAASAASATWPTCRPDQLAGSGRVVGAGLGNVGAIVTLENRSTAACQLQGYPDLRLMAADGRTLPATVRDLTTTDDYLFPAIQPHRVSLAPGAFASFQIGYGDNPFGPEATAAYDVACPTVAAVAVLLPGMTASTIAPIAMAPCAGVLDVSALFAGRSWISFAPDG